jgi:hypothetical protein
MHSPNTGSRWQVTFENKFAFLPDTRPNPETLLGIIDDPVWQPGNQAEFTGQHGTLILQRSRLPSDITHA